MWNIFSKNSLNIINDDVINGYLKFVINYYVINKFDNLSNGDFQIDIIRYECHRS